jgi:hypothetical protein
MRASLISVLVLVGCEATGIHPRGDSGDPIEPSDDAGIDAGIDGAIDAGAPSVPLAIRLSTDACADLAEPHVEAPLFGFEVTGTPHTFVDIRAERPQCGVAPFLYATVELDAEGRNVLTRFHEGTTSCSDPLLGMWRVFAQQGTRVSEPLELSFESSACAAPSCASAATFCPEAPEPDTDAGVPSDAGPPPDPGCDVLADWPGLAFVSTEAALRRVESFPASASTQYRRFEVSLDLRFPAWTPKQGQYEVFSILRGRRWTEYAIGYVSLVGPASRAVVTTANLGLEGAAAPPGGDGRRASDNYPFEVERDYHFEYFYDAELGMRRLEVYEGTTLIASAQGETFVDTIDIEPEGARIVLGGAEVEGAPDASTLGWRFSNVRLRACR